MRFTIKCIATLLFFFGTLNYSVIIAQGNPQLSNVLTKVNKQLIYYHANSPDEKIYLHLNKQHYFTGEHIWFSAYIVNYHTLIPDTSSRIIYVDLCNAKGERAQTCILENKNGFATGDFTLSDTINSGEYLIRSYSNWMQNFSEECIFRTKITISNPNDSFAPEKVSQSKQIMRKTKHLHENIIVDIKPESAILLQGISNKIIINAKDGFGNPVETTCILLEDNVKINDSITTNKSGLGFFYLTPQNQKKYVLEVAPSGNLKPIKIKFPEQKTEGISLSIDEKPTKIHTILNYHGLTNKDFLLLLYCNGQIISKKTISLTGEKKTVSFEKNTLPQGTILFTIFNAQGEPVAERFFYNNLNQKLNYKIASTKYFPDKNQLKLLIKCEDKNGNPVSSQFSFSVNDANFEGSRSTSPNIITYYSLYSEFKQPLIPLDYTSLTENYGDLYAASANHVYFNWQQILSNELPKLKYEKEKGINLAGRITKYFFDIPVNKAKVKLTILDEYLDERTCITNKSGEFYFNDLYYYDTINVLIEARTKTGKKNIMILVEEQPEIWDKKLLYEISEDEFAEIKSKRKYNKSNSGQNNNYVESPFNIYGEADQIVRFDDSYNNYNSPLEAIKGRVPGLRVSGSGMNARAIIRGIGTLMGSTEPLYLIDGTPVDIHAVNSMNIYDIDRIEVLKSGSKTAMFGSRGSNGVIAIYTKRGHFMKRGEIQFKILGYYKPVDFTLPNYFSNDKESFDKYVSGLFWAPNVKTDTSGMIELTIPLPNRSKYNIQIQGSDLNGLFGELSQELNNP